MNGVDLWDKLIALSEEITKAFTQALDPNALSESFYPFAVRSIRCQIASEGLRNKFGVHQDTADWLAWRLPDKALPSKEGAEALLALKKLGGDV